MDDLQRLVAIEAIKTLMARRVRCIDEKDWSGFADCYTDDARSYTFSSDERPDDVLIGGTAIAERVANTLAGVRTVHQVHEPEIDIASSDQASAIWPLNDLLHFPAPPRTMRAYGHYRQQYRKHSGRWLITEQRLTRLWVEIDGVLQT